MKPHFLIPWQCSAFRPNNGSLYILICLSTDFQFLQHLVTSHCFLSVALFFLPLMRVDLKISYRPEVSHNNYSQWYSAIIKRLVNITQMSTMNEKYGQLQAKQTLLTKWMCQNQLQKWKNNRYYNIRIQCNLLTGAFLMWAFHWDSFEDTIQQNAGTHQSIRGNSKWVCRSELCDRGHSLHSCWNRVVYVQLQGIQIKLCLWYTCSSSNRLLYKCYFMTGLHFLTLLNKYGVAQNSLDIQNTIIFNSVSQTQR